MLINFLMGITQMSQTQAAPQATYAQASFSEVELCAHWNKSPRTLFNWRKAGKMPAFFRRGSEVRYLLSDIEKFEKNSGK